MPEGFPNITMPAKKPLPDAYLNSAMKPLPDGLLNAAMKLLPYGIDTATPFHLSDVIKVPANLSDVINTASSANSDVIKAALLPHQSSYWLHPSCHSSCSGQQTIQQLVQSGI